MEGFRFSAQEIQSFISDEDYSLYQKAILSREAQDWYKAGDAFDVTYTGSWGDALFSGIKPNPEDMYEFSLTCLYYGVPNSMVPELYKMDMPRNKNRFLVSCELYLKALEANPDHYFANIQLATALTAALQISASVLYWLKALEINKKDTIAALFADCQGKFHRGDAANAVVTILSEEKTQGERVLKSLLAKPSFSSQCFEARDLLKSSPFISRHVKNL